MDQPGFLTLSEVLHLHDLSLARFGGASAVGDLGLVDSAMVQHRTHTGTPVQTCLRLPRPTHTCIARAQAFLDGNKRTAVASAFVFLSANEVKIGPEQDERVYRAMIDIAEKRMDKTGLAEVFRNLAHGK